MSKDMLFAQAFEELTKCWGKWLISRDKLIICFVVNLRSQMVKKGTCKSHLVAFYYWLCRNRA